MVRNVLGSILALVGAAAAVVSPFRAWNDGRDGRDFRLSDLFTGSGITDARPELYASLLLPFAVAALVTLVGIALRSRLLVTLAGLIVLGFAVLWMVREGQAKGSLTVNGDSSGLGPGLAAACGGGVLLLIAAVLMSGRQRREAPDERYGYADPADPDGPAGQDAAWDPMTSPDPAARGDGQDSTTRTMPTLDDPYGTGTPYDTGRQRPRPDPYGRGDPYGGSGPYGNGGQDAPHHGSSPYGGNDPYGRNNPYGGSGSGQRGWQPPPDDRR